MIKIFNKILIIITLCLFITSCNSVKKAFDPERKNSSEEFLVELVDNNRNNETV